MNGKAMSLKAKIRNLSKEKGLPATVVLQNYMFERFLDRLSRSTYKENFILKGGILIASLVGIDRRATMDLDTTIKNYPFNIDSVTKAVVDICKYELEDNVKFNVKGVDLIREDDTYGGFRVSILAEYETIIVPMKIDITTGDTITPNEINYLYKMNFSESTIDVLSYNLETILAEKVETILSRGELNTRPRDFYDVFILTKTLNFIPSIFALALKSTAAHRKTAHIFNNIDKRLIEIEESESLKVRWKKYTKDYNYAKDVTYFDVMSSLKKLTNDI